MKALALVALLFPTPGFAQTADFCPSLFQLSQRLRTCSFNALFVKSADDCNMAIDRISARKSAQLGVTLGSNDASSPEAQSAKLASHAANLRDTATSLRDLRDNAVRAKAQMQEYLDNFMHPGKIDKKLAARLHKPFLDWLERFPCYSENRALISRYLGVMDGKIASLDRTLSQVAQLAGSTDSAFRGVSSDSASGLKAVSGKSAPPRPATPGTRAPASASSITGVDEDAAKRAKAP